MTKQQFESWKDNFLSSIEEDKELRQLFNSTQELMRDIASALHDKSLDLDFTAVAIGSAGMDSVGIPQGCRQG